MHPWDGLKKTKNNVWIGIKLKSQTNTTQDTPMFLALASNLNVIKIQIFHMYT